MTDEYTEAHNALNNATEALNALMYGPGWNYLTEDAREAVTRALEKLENLHGAPEEPEPVPEAHKLCLTCGSLDHEAEDCTNEGLAPGSYDRAWKRHVDHLPNNPTDCAAAGHCGHKPCCNCSGIMPDRATYDRLTAEILAAADV